MGRFRALQDQKQLFLPLQKLICKKLTVAHVKENMPFAMENLMPFELSPTIFIS